MTDIVDILLATYNGETYLDQQIASIIEQSCQNWRIIARDDGSQDATVSILEKYRDRLGDQFILLDCAEGNLGVVRNFSYIIGYSTAPYVMFCDQDDIWMPDKILLTLNAMKIAESNSTPEIPLLVHTNLKVVDEQLSTIACSFWKYQNLDPRLDTFNRLLIQNTVTGCTVMVNRKLLDMALPIPQQVIMHDWWMGLVAAAFGHIVIVEQATVLYRQHAHNDTGAKHWSYHYVITKALTFFKRVNLLNTIAHSQQQAGAFGKRFDALLSVEQKKIIDYFVKLHDKGFLSKRVFLYQHKLLKQGIIRNLGLLLRI